jgi:hypothetical protein
MFRMVARLARDQGDVRRRDGHVRPRADGDPHIRLGQRRGVVDAVADHPDQLPLVL